MATNGVSWDCVFCRNRVTIVDSALVHSDPDCDEFACADANSFIRQTIVIIRDLLKVKSALSSRASHAFGLR